MIHKIGLVSAFAIASMLSSNVFTVNAAERHLSSRVVKLQGDWVATLQGNTGCGSNSLLVAFHLDANGSGNGTATVTSHSTGCSDATLSNQSFNVTSLDQFGRGTAGLTCGAGCGWGFQIQIDKRSDIIAITDVDPGNPNNTPTGVAIKQ